MFRERVLAGQARARAAGKRWGGSRPGVRVKVTREHEELIQALKAEGETIAAIARLMRLSRQTIYKVLGHS